VKSASPNTHSTLWGVSCPGTKLCEAVGGSQAGAGSQTLVERWTGTKWASSGSANPSGRDGFNGVSCTSLRICKPVGYEVVGANVYDSLIERGA